MWYFGLEGLFAETEQEQAWLWQRRGGLLFCIPTPGPDQKKTRRPISRLSRGSGATAPLAPLACPVSATTQAHAPATLGLKVVSFARQDATIAMSVGQDKWWPRAADLQCRGPPVPGPVRKRQGLANKGRRLGDRSRRSRGGRDLQCHLRFKHQP